MNIKKALWTIGSLIGAQQAMKAIRRLETNDLLGLVGAERRRSTAHSLLPAVGWVSLGAVVGAGTALLIAPSSGEELRQRLSERVDKLADKINELHAETHSHPSMQS